MTPPISESRSLVDELTEAARERLNQFAADCAARGVQCSTQTRTGIPPEVVSQEATAHDIVVVSRSGYSRPGLDSLKIEPFVAQVIRGSVRPVLVAGRQTSGESDIRSILIVYDGSPHAARVLFVAAELGRRPGVECTLANVSVSEEAGMECLSRAESYLCNHGVIPRKRVVIGARASDVICGLVETSKPDLLVMGAYGHSPVREVLFGSTTEKVLAHCAASVVLQS